MSDDLEAGIGEIVANKLPKANGGDELATALTNAVLGAAEKCAKQLEDDGDELVKMAELRRQTNYDVAKIIRDCARDRAKDNSTFVEALKDSASLTNQIVEKFIPQPQPPLQTFTPGPLTP